MAKLANLLIDPSAFPDRLRQDLLESLRSRRIAPKLHYESFKQARHWLQLHEAYSPARRDPDCFRIYDQAFARAVDSFTGRQLHLVGLGTGGGQKEASLLKRLRPGPAEIAYTPTDVSVPLALAARQAALDCLRSEACRPLIIDLATATDLPGALAASGPSWASSAPRWVTLFGVLPNFEPDALPDLLAKSVRRGDTLLLSANLAPGDDYARSVCRILPLYENDLTREWLLLLLLDLGVERADGAIRFSVEDSPVSGLKQVVASFGFARECRLEVHGESFHFVPGEQLRLFYSNRHTIPLTTELLRAAGLTLLEHWVNQSGEEGVFLARRP